MDCLDIEQQLSADQRRGRYVRVSDADRRQLIDAYKKNEDFIALAKRLNIKRSTARSILRTFIDEGRVSAKQRAGTRLRFITEDEAEIIREMKRRHPLITIGQIQMRLQKTSNRVLSKASISRILTNSIRLGKRAKRSFQTNMDDQDEFNDKMNSGTEDMVQASSDEGTEGAFYIDEDEEDDDEDDEDEPLALTKRPNGAVQNLEDFQRFMLTKSGLNGDESVNNEVATWNVNKGSKQYEPPNGEMYDENYPIKYPNFNSDGDDEELSEIDENESKSPNETPSNGKLNHGHPNGGGDTSGSVETGNWNGNQSSVKSEPVCVFLNQNYDSSDSEAACTVEDRPAKPAIHVAPSSSNNRRIKICPICGEKNFFKLSHHLTVAHNMNREESLTLIAHAGRKSTTPHRSMMATVSDSSPKMISNNDSEMSPQPTPISITTSNQQITSESSPPLAPIDPENNGSSLNPEQISSNYSPIDGKKRLLCPRCDTWVLNLTDHLIKKHHLLSKQERLPFLRLARTRQHTGNNEKLSNNSFLITSEQSNANHEQQKQLHILQQQAANNRKYQNIIKKYRKAFVNNHHHPSSSSHNASISLSNGEISSSPSNQNLLSISTNQSALSSNVSPQEKLSQLSARMQLMGKNNGTPSTTRDLQQMAIHQKFEQRLTVFRQQFAVTLAMQNSLMQQMELLQRSFVSIEEEWNDMKKEANVSSS